MKVMISQPMRGKTNEQIREEREKLVKQLKTEGHEVIDTVFDDFISPRFNNVSIIPRRQSNTSTLFSKIY